jgi:hypothetical protein
LESDTPHPKKNVSSRRSADGGPKPDRRPENPDPLAYPTAFLSLRAIMSLVEVSSASESTSAVLGADSRLHCTPKRRRNCGKNQEPGEGAKLCRYSVRVEADPNSVLTPAAHRASDRTIGSAHGRHV